MSRLGLVLNNRAKLRRYFSPIFRLVKLGYNFVGLSVALVPGKRYYYTALGVLTLSSNSH
jgi:hypothetical protein